MASRTGQGSATANSVTAQTSVSHANQTMAAGREGTSSIREQDAAQGGVSGIGWDIARQQISRDIRIGQFQKLDEGRAFVACGTAVPGAQITKQQEVELLHAPAAAPLELAEFDLGRH
jgi:hypothetical protein